MTCSTPPHLSDITAEQLADLYVQGRMDSLKDLLDSLRRKINQGHIDSFRMTELSETIDALNYISRSRKNDVMEVLSGHKSPIQ